MPDELEERLRSHARSFDSLLSLIPAKLYYGEDVSDQWQRKKQTPEQKRAAKMAKLDPENWKSAKDLMDERAAAAKRKREEAEDDSDSGSLGVEPEKPKAAQDQEPHKTKKRKTNDKTADPKAITETVQLSKSSIKRQKKAEKRAAEVQKQEQKKARKAAIESAQTVTASKDDEWSDVHDDDGLELVEPIDLQQTPASGAGEVDMADAASTATPSSEASDIMSPPAESASSSISSIQPGASANSSKSQKQAKLSKAPVGVKTDLLQEQSSSNASAAPLNTLNDTDKAAARDRLSAAISTFRTQRKADTNPRSRQQLLDLRRQKEEQRRLAKKEQRRLESEAAALAADEEIERRFSPGGSGSLLGSPRSPPQSPDAGDAGANSFSFGRITFTDGTSLDPSTSDSLIQNRKGKGPRDTQTALLAAKNKASRLAGLDPTKRKEIEEKDMWLNAKRRAHGERVKDDTSLLKRALKRQESQKKKSEKEWTDRKEGIQKAQEMKQKKRTENLAKRKDEKKQGKKVAGGKGKVKVKRPGFEGSFRGRSGKKK